jgi:Holliday junction DNA helicase RuvB
MTTEEPVAVDERNWRPTTLDDFVGQTAIKAPLKLMLQSAKARRAVLEHLCFYGGPGLGKTSLAFIIAQFMGGSLREMAAPAVAKPGDLVQVLTLLQQGDVLFLDEIHALRREIAELLYSAMEDFKVGIQLDSESPPIQLHLKRFTLVGATTDFGLLPEPLRARFGQLFPLDLYTPAELQQVIARAADKSGVLIDRASLAMIATRARGTPRLALRLFRRCFDLAVVQEADLWSDVTAEALNLLHVDELGLDDADRRYLLSLVEVYEGGPVGLKALAASAGLDFVTAEQSIEPWLVCSGLVARTRTGRRITKKGLEHILPGVGLKAPRISFEPDLDIAEDG